MKLLITNIERSLNALDFEKLFEKVGKLKSCTLVLDEKTKLSKGFGFVEYEVTEVAQKAIELLNGRLVNGKHMKVKSA